MAQLPLALRVADYLAIPRPPTQWLVESLVPTSGLAVIHGDPKIGKSYAALQMAYQMAAEQPSAWLGFPVGGQARVVYVQLDTPELMWQDTVAKLKASGHPIVSERLFLADRVTLDTWPFDIHNPEHAAKLQALNNSIRPDAFFIDCFAETHRIPEKDNTGLIGAMNALIGVTHPAAVVLVHHSKKPNYEYGPDVINDSRGGNSITGKADAVIRFTKTGMHYAGRAVEHGSKKLVRGDDYTWALDDENERMIQVFVDGIVNDPELKKVSQRERSRILAEKAGLEEEHARNILRAAEKRRG